MIKRSNGRRQKVCVHADSVLCVGQMKDSPGAIERWKGQEEGLRMYSSYQDAVGLDGEATEFCWQYTSPDAHTRTFLVVRVTFHSCALRMAWDVLGWRGSASSFCVLFHVVLFDVVVEHSSSSVPTSPILVHRVTVQTFRVHNVKLQSKLLCLRSLDWNVWLLGQSDSTQGMSPTSTTTWTRSTRRSISLTVTEVSRAATTPPQSPPQRIQNVFRIQEHPAAASTPQQAGFPQC